VPITTKVVNINKKKQSKNSIIFFIQNNNNYFGGRDIFGGLVGRQTVNNVLHHTTDNRSLARIFQDVWFL
jgi:hypothetical protein